MKKLILSVAILFIPAMALHAQSPSFYPLDIDNDSFISKTEAEENLDLTKVFDTLDANFDGQLSLEEYETLVTRES